MYKLSEENNCLNCPYKDMGFVYPSLTIASDILFIGQSPEKEELKEGYPLSEKSSSIKILRKYLKEITSTYSITNAVKCLTPFNKVPSKKDIERCKPFLLKDIEYVNPKLLVVFGKSAFFAVTGKVSNILKINGHILNDFKIPVLVCVNPKYVNRIKDEKIFEKGILPALKYFMEEKKVEYTETDKLEYTKEETALDIETTGLKPYNSEIICFSISNTENKFIGGGKE